MVDDITISIAMFEKKVNPQTDKITRSISRFYDKKAKLKVLTASNRLIFVAIDKR